MTGFTSFSPQHILWLFLLISTGAVTIRFFPTRGRNVGAALAVLGRILPGIYEIGKGAYGLSSLPLHVCAMAGYGCFLHRILTRSKVRNDTLLPARRQAFIPICFCLLYCAVMLPFDRATGMNYGFLLQPAPDSPLSWIAAVAGGGVGYYLLYGLLVMVVMGICFSII